MRTLPFVLAAALPLAALAFQEPQRPHADGNGAQWRAAAAYEPSSVGVIDAYITGRLVTAYGLSEHLRPYQLHVEVKDRLVTLHGAVESEVLRDLAVEVARSVPEVRDVRSQIRVESAAPRAAGNGRDSFAQRFSDAATTARVKSRLIWNDSTHGLTIRVDTADGVVTLAGEVRSDAESALAQQIASNTRGVRRVDNRLNVHKERMSARRPD